VRSALGGSQNVGAFRAAQEIGIPSVIAYAKALGITTLESGFDPTWYDHGAIFYGPSVAVGGANVRAIDMAYMDATIANMGYGRRAHPRPRARRRTRLVRRCEGRWRPGSARQFDFSPGTPSGTHLDRSGAQVQSLQGGTLYPRRGHGRKAVVDRIGGCTRCRIARPLDLAVRQLRRRQPAGRVSRCTNRWGEDRDSRADAGNTLATWMTGYTRCKHAVWVGNSNKQLVRAARGAGYASANTTIRLLNAGWRSTPT
jgi:hypothetical protein